MSDVCERSPLPVSVKTRLGLESDDEYERVLDLYCRMPLAELIVHPRVQKDRYAGSPRKEFYGETLERARSRWPTTATSLILRRWMRWWRPIPERARNVGARLACEPRAGSHG